MVDERPRITIVVLGIHSADELRFANLTHNPPHLRN